MNPPAEYYVVDITLILIWIRPSFNSRLWFRKSKNKEQRLLKGGEGGGLKLSWFGAGNLKLVKKLFHADGRQKSQLFNKTFRNIDLSRHVWSNKVKELPLPFVFNKINWTRKNWAQIEKICKIFTAFSVIRIQNGNRKIDCISFLIAQNRSVYQFSSIWYY